MNLKQLTYLILSLNETPLTRIRLTKAIYFMHKDLVRKKIMKLQDITYIRLPLGPAPEGLPEVIQDNPHIIVDHIASGLLYENKTYTINQKYTDFTPETINSIKKLLRLLQSYRTTELVQASQDPSWLTHKNGERYTLTAADLKNNFPNNQLHLRIRIKTTSNEIGSLQATLIRGMIADIVKESTDLEYPDDKTKSQTTDNDKDSIKLRKFTIKLPSWPKKKDK